MLVAKWEEDRATTELDRPPEALELHYDRAENHFYKALRADPSGHMRVHYQLAKLYEVGLLLPTTTTTNNTTTTTTLLLLIILILM